MESRYFGFPCFPLLGISNGGELEQIQLAARARVHTDRREISGDGADLSVAVNDGLGLEMDLKTCGALPGLV